MKTIYLSDEIVKEIERVCRTSDPGTIVKGSNYLYFCVNRIVSGHDTKHLTSTGHLSLTGFFNVKNQVSGYLVLFHGNPELNIHPTTGVGIYYGRKYKNYKEQSVCFTDQKIRLISFDSVDYFVGIKWKTDAESDDGE